MSSPALKMSHPLSLSFTILPTSSIDRKSSKILTPYQRKGPFCTSFTPVRRKSCIQSRRRHRHRIENDERHSASEERLHKEHLCIEPLLTEFIAKAFTLSIIHGPQTTDASSYQTLRKNPRTEGNSGSKHTIHGQPKSRELVKVLPRNTIIFTSHIPSFSSGRCSHTVSQRTNRPLQLFIMGENGLSQTG